MADTEGQDLIDKLKVDRPNVAITVTRFEDHMDWDGDGEDPALEGYVCCTVEVGATMVTGGKPVRGLSMLGSSYYLPDEPCGEVHGYLRQMVEEAVAELDKELARG